MVEKKLTMPSLHRKVLVHYTKGNARTRTNSIFLIASYAVLYLDWSPDRMYKDFVKLQLPLVPFRDASFGPSIYNLGMIDVLKGLIKAKGFGFLNFDQFSLDEYRYYERVENGDFNWIIPDQFLAFSGPHGTRSYANGYSLFTPEDYISYFKTNNIQAVIRLNKKMYDKRQFTSHGLSHHDLFFVDGSNPSITIVDSFLDICEQHIHNNKGAVAVHCKAGLGRTGTLIGCYLMKHYRFTAPEAIAWIRVCRPGSVIGPQQLFLEELQTRMWRAGESSNIASTTMRNTRANALRQPSQTTQQSIASSVDQANDTAVAISTRKKKKDSSQNNLVRPKSVVFSGTIRSPAESEELLTSSLQGVKLVSTRSHHHHTLTRAATASQLHHVDLSDRPHSQGAGLMARKARNMSVTSSPGGTGGGGSSGGSAENSSMGSFLKGTGTGMNLGGKITRSGSVVETRLNSTIGSVSGVRMTRASTLRAKSAHSRGRNHVTGADALSVVGRSSARK